ncbi:hypothetical protein [Umezawaea beigongshangensis]|uniref:hypothetical protein n=1 Tax=Umezawaea beigongshangensis TaxID=2780383 RepID=UPI0027DC6FA5|nr:hypothetical protein [Umezawaea beigongshangensis]
MVARPRTSSITRSYTSKVIAPKHTYFTVGQQIAVACPQLTSADGASLVMAASAFVAKLFPLTRPPEALRQLYDREPEIARVFPPFRPTLRRTIAATAAGLPTVR